MNDKTELGFLHIATVYMNVKRKRGVQSELFNQKSCTLTILCRNVILAKHYNNSEMHLKKYFSYLIYKHTLQWFIGIINNQ